MPYNHLIPKFDFFNLKQLIHFEVVFSSTGNAVVIIGLTR